MLPYQKQKKINEIKRLQSMKSRYKLSSQELAYIDKMIKYLQRQIDDNYKYRYYND